jgi:regulation of enolase protein 1 (concanavalin A-like superfamily)
MKYSRLTAVLFCLFFYSAIQANDSVKIASIPFPLYWENKPVAYTVNGNSLSVKAGPKTDMFRDPNVTYNTDNAPKLMFKTSQDFVLISKIEHAFTAKWDGGALILKADSLNWIKFCFEKDYTGSRRIVSVVTKDISDDCNSIAMISNAAWFKMAKAGNVITLYASSDGKKWLLVRHFQFPPKEVQVGFLAQSPSGSGCRVLFSAIKYIRKTIKDPYVGE